MKIQCLNKNLINALTGIKENQVNILNVVVNRKPLLECLKLHKHIDLAEFQTGKTTWRYNPDIQDTPSLRLVLGRNTMTFFNQKTDFKNPYPAKLEFNNFASKSGILVNAGKLIESLNFVMPCMASEDTRMALHSVLFHSENNTLKFITADGFRLGKYTMDVTGIPNDKVLLSSEDITRLMSFLKTIKPTGKGKLKAYPDINMDYQDAVIKFTSENASIDCERLDKPSACYPDGLKFPDYEQLIPNKDDYKIEFYADDMLKAVKSLKSIAQGGAGTIRMQFFKGTYFNDINLTDINSKCLLSAKSEEIGANAVEIDCKVNQDCKFALNYTYLQDYLEQVKNQMVTLYITSPSSPAKFETSNNKVCVIMPMFVQWDDKSEIKIEDSKPIEVPESVEVEA